MYIFESAILPYRNGVIQAKLLNPFSWDIAVKWDIASPLEPINELLPPFQFEVRRDVPHPDNYFTGANIELYSGRLMEIFQDYGEIKYESFATEIHERRSKHKILQDYRVFRLMETFPFIDPQRSELSHDGTIIKRAVLYDGAEDRAPALFRDEHFKHLVFMSRSLRNAIDNHGFTGCQFQTLDEYSAKLRLLHRF